MGTASPVTSIPWQPLGEKQKAGRKVAARVHTLPRVMLGKRQEPRPGSGSNDRVPSKAGKHSSPGPPASQEGLPGPGFPGLHPGEGQDLGEQVELRKVKKAMSDNSTVSGSLGMGLAFSYSLVLNLESFCLLNGRPRKHSSSSGKN